MSVSAHGFLATSNFKDVLANATAELDLSGGASVAAFVVSVDNSQNNVAVYLKIYNATAPTVGTTAPEWVFKCPAGAKRTQAFGTRATGRTLATGLSFAVVTAGGTAGTTGPTNPVGVQIATN